MALNAAEEETLESLKKWWEENGRNLVIAVVLLLGGYTGWLLWQNAQADSAATASDLYEEILSLSLEEPGAILSEQDSNRIIEISRQLRSEFESSIYARFAALFAAQQQVEQGRLADAEANLQWILDNPDQGMFNEVDEGLLLTTSLRLGRVILAQGDAERALSFINGIDPKSFEGGFAELRGDIYVAMDRVVDARDAYIAAQQAGSQSDGLRMKLDSLPDQG